MGGVLRITGQNCSPLSSSPIGSFALVRHQLRLLPLSTRPIPIMNLAAVARSQKELPPHVSYI